MPDKTENPDFKIELSADRLTARLVAAQAALNKNWDSEELTKQATAAGLPSTPELTAVLESLQEAKKRPAKTDTFEIARGTAPIDAAGNSLLYNHAGGFVAKGTAIGQVQAPRGGTNGVDVTGAVIPFAPATQTELQLPAMTRLESDTLIAEADLYLYIDSKGCRTEPITVVERLESNNQAIVFDRTILVRGNVHKGIPIQARRSLVIDGSIDAAVIAAAHDFRVGGIFGRAAGRIVVGRNLHATFIRQAQVVVNGNMHVAADVSDCDVTCLGQLIAPEADIRGGRVHAEAGIEVRAIGTDAYIRSTIEIGLDLAFDKLLESKKTSIINGRKRIEQVRMHIKPLMANPKRLTNVQKEKATELLFQADELQNTIDADLNELRSAMDLMKRRAESALVVRSAIYPGTTIRFQGVETTVRSTITGPCRIAVQAVGEKPRIVLFLGTNPTPQLLESRMIPQNAFTEMRKLAA